MATRREGLPEVWVTTAAQMLVGELSCEFRAWFKAHHSRYEKVPSGFDSAAWKAAHTDHLRAIVKELEADDWKCRVEQYARVTGQTAVLAGKPDVIAQKNGVTKIVDAKSGEPKESHVAQVAILMVMLPMAWERPSMHVTGEVIYRGEGPISARVSVGPEQALELKPKLFTLMRELAVPMPLPARPSEQGCKFCDIQRGDCPSRFTGSEALEASTTLF